MISQARGSAGKTAADTSVRGRRLTVLAASLGFAMVQLDVSVVNVAVRSIGSDLGGTITGMQWVVSAYTVAFAALILSAGALGDRVGAKRVFACGFAPFTLASAACALAPDLGLLIGARAVQGVGAAVLVPCSLVLLTHAYPDAKARAHAIGLWAAGASVALSAGPLIGGLLIASLGWRAIFPINAPIGLGGIALTLRYARETTRAQLIVLGFGLGLLVPAMTSALLGSVDTSRSGVASGTLNTTRQAGSVIGVALFGSLAAAHLVSGLRIAVLISVVLALAVLALSTAVENRPGGSPPRLMRVSVRHAPDHGLFDFDESHQRGDCSSPRPARRWKRSARPARPQGNCRDVD